MIELTSDLADRFWSRVEKTEGCWLWRGYVRKTGYGRFHHSRTQADAAHRIAYMLANGPIESSGFVCHHCDNKLCVNPAHLFLGDAEANAHDAMRKGRNTKGVTHGRAKLTEAQVLEIRRRYAANEAGQERLAKEYGVSDRQIFMIVHRKCWAHLDDGLGNIVKPVELWHTSGARALVDSGPEPFDASGVNWDGATVKAAGRKAMAELFGEVAA